MSEYDKVCADLDKAKQLLRDAQAAVRELEHAKQQAWVELQNHKRGYYLYEKAMANTINEVARAQRQRR